MKKFDIKLITQWEWYIINLTVNSLFRKNIIKFTCFVAYSQSGSSKSIYEKLTTGIDAEIKQLRKRVKKLAAPQIKTDL